MNWLSLIGPLLKFMAALAGWLRERALIAAGEARGRAASDSAHARAAAEQETRMREIAARPPSRHEVERRLEEGSG